MKNLIIFKRQSVKKVLLILGVFGVGLIASHAPNIGTLVSTYYMNLKGTVKSKESSQVINGIQVEVINGNQANGLTGTNGAFSDEFVDR